MAKFPFDLKNEIIILHVLVKGTRDEKLLKMVLDTGASITSIPDAIAITIGCDLTRPKRRIEIITASGTKDVPVVVVPKISFLGFELKDIEVACLNLPLQSAVSGLLGLNILKKFRLVLDLPKKILEITLP